MSRIGRRKINIPEGVTVTMTDKQVKVKGPKGELTQMLHPHVKVEQKDMQIVVRVRKSEDKDDRALWGLHNALVNNMIVGVSEGFSKQLEINGVGFKAAVEGKKLVLHVGFSHPAELEIPQGIEISVEKNVITVSGTDKQQVGEVAAKIRSFKKPEPYKGKGIKYIDEHVRRKAGKQAKGAGEGEG